jgi:hypothetical protein
MVSARTMVGKVVVVTGANGGIEHSVSRRVRQKPPPTTPPQSGFGSSARRWSLPKPGGRLLGLAACVR